MGIAVGVLVGLAVGVAVGAPVGVAVGAENSAINGLGLTTASLFAYCGVLIGAVQMMKNPL